MSTIKVYYLRSLKDTGKIASQVAHAVLGLNLTSHPDKIIVLKASKSQLEGFLSSIPNVYGQIDLGFTEVDTGTLTAIAYEI